MNGSTAKIINRASQMYRIHSRRLKREYHKLNHMEKGQAKANMQRFCMDLKQERATAIRQIREEKAEKVKREKIPTRNAIRDIQNEKNNPSMIRWFVAWIMLKLGIWNWETSYRYERHLEPKS